MGSRSSSTVARPGRGSAFIECTVNGLPGLLAQQDGNIATVFAFEIARGRIRHIWAVRNPEKLRPWRIS